MSTMPYQDLGFCLECAYNHIRDTEHHLEDAVKFGKGNPDRAKFQELLDQVRIVRKEVDKLRMEQIERSGGEMCIACELPHKGNPNGLGEAVIGGIAAGVGSVVGAKLLEGKEEPPGSPNPDKNPDQNPEIKIFKTEREYMKWIEEKGYLTEPKPYPGIFKGPKRVGSHYETPRGIEVILCSSSNPEIPEICEFTHEEIQKKEDFDPRSFRTICPEVCTLEDIEKGLCKPEERARCAFATKMGIPCATRIIVGCPKNKFVKGRCSVSTKTHAIYHTKGVKG